MPTTEDVLAEIVRRLVAEFDPEEIILFGSCAWGQPLPESDYDFFVIVSHSDERPTRRATRAYSRLRGIPVPTDVLVHTRAEVERFRDVYASLEAEVLERGKVLYKMTAEDSHLALGSRRWVPPVGAMSGRQGSGRATWDSLTKGPFRRAASGVKQIWTRP
jgi:predicted nucleotidyltransferase